MRQVECVAVMNVKNCGLIIYLFVLKMASESQENGGFAILPPTNTGTALTPTLTPGFGDDEELLTPHPPIASSMLERMKALLASGESDIKDTSGPDPDLVALMNQPTPASQEGQQQEQQQEQQQQQPPQ
jgi:hypothetical protein